MAKETSVVGIRLSNKLIEYIKKIARKKSYEENKSITFSKLLREAVEKCYPIK